MKWLLQILMKSVNQKKESCVLKETSNILDIVSNKILWQKTCKNLTLKIDPGRKWPILYTDVKGKHMYFIYICVAINIWYIILSDDIVSGWLWMPADFI